LKELKNVIEKAYQYAIGLGKGNVFTEKGVETWLAELYVKNLDLLKERGLEEYYLKSVSFQHKGIRILLWISREAYEILRELDDDRVDDIDIRFRGLIEIPEKEAFINNFNLKEQNLGILSISTREDALELLKKIRVKDVKEEIREEIKKMSLEEKIRYVIDNIEIFIKHLGNLDVEDFEKAKTEVKASITYNIIDYVFNVIRVLPLEPSEESVTYIAHENTLYEPEEIIKPIVGSLITKAYSKRNLVKEVELATYSTGKTIYWWQIDPWEMLNLYNGVLDLRELKIKESSSEYYFRHRLLIKISDKDLDEIRSDSYDIEKNEVYKLWRKHFDDENWEYFVHSVGTWLRPERSKHIAFLIGPSDSGKSTLLHVLTKPIKPIVAHVDLRSITSYQFGLEALVGKLINVYSERGETVLRNIDMINNLVGEKDYITVQRKHKSAVTIRSLKTMMFSMNDPPVLSEYGGETLRAFLNRLSIILIKQPEDFKPIPDLDVDPREAFMFLLWARRQLEKNNWVIKKMNDDDMINYLMRETNSALKFLEESDVIVKDPSSVVKGTDLYEAYVDWCMKNGLKAFDRNRFYTIVGSRFQAYERVGSKWFRGLRLKK
jgi:phage/plasmid-associated DNA primase